MSSFSDYLENRILEHIFRAQASAAPVAVYLALFTAVPNDAGGGTEVTGGGYARQPITFGPASGGAISNTAAITFTASGAAFGTIVAVGLFDAATGGNMLAWDEIASATIGDGDRLEVPAGDLDISLT